MSREPHIRERLVALFPGATVESMRPLGPDDSEDTGGTGEHCDVTSKGIGYGRPVRVVMRDAGGERRDLVFHTATANAFGHDRRSDRAQEMLLAYDTFRDIPSHVSAVDVGAIGDDGVLTSLQHTGDFYLITDWADGALYAEDLRRVARTHQATLIDMRRCEALADYLVKLHSQRHGDASLYRRAVRDLVGSGEGIYGIADGYPPDAPGAPASRLAAIESSCATWRWRLRGREERLARTHGDFHPFNILFDDEHRLSLLDASRGCLGDPADDVTCLALNYVFFALEDPESWENGFAPLWRRFWTRYLTQTADRELLEVAPPYLAWRALVLANPVWYPNVPEAGRDAMLNLVESALSAGRFAPETAEKVFR